mgnify:CR=1 FL=1
MLGGSVYRVNLSRDRKICLIHLSVEFGQGDGADAHQNRGKEEIIGNKCIETDVFIQRERFISGVAGNNGKADHVVWKMTEKCQIGDHDQSVTDGLSVGKGFKMRESINLPVGPEEIQCACHYDKIV